MRVRWSNVVLLSALPACPVAVAPWLASWHWSIDLLACFPVQAMGALFLAGLLLLLAKRPKPALVLLAFAASAAAAVLPAWLRSPPAGSPDGATVRVLSLNLLCGNEAAAARALAVVAEHDPDVLFCSEVTPRWLAALAPALPQLPHRCVRADPGFFGVALFSRWPLSDATVLPLAYEWAPAVRAVVQTPSGPLGLLGVHVPRPGGGRRSLERDQALAAVPAALSPLPATRMLIGDCNSTPWNPAFRSLLATTRLQDASDGGWQPTWTSMLPWPLRIPIDHVLVNSELGVTSYAAGRDFGSDHLPLLAILKLPPRR